MNSILNFAMKPNSSSPQPARLRLGRSLLTGLASLLATGALLAADAAPRISPLGPPLPGPVVDVFLPPTRASEPYAATAQAAFRYSAAKKSWQRLYQPALADNRLAGIAGYARSSKVLYVAHALGVARTRDAGASWVELLPLGLGPASGSFLSLSVNPTNRYEAVLAHEHALWRITDQAGMFEPIELADQVGTLRAVAYAGVAPARLVVVGEKGVFLETDRGAWQRLELPTGPPVAAAVSPNMPLWLVTGASNCWAGDFTRPGFGQAVALTAPADAARLALDCTGRGVIWWAASNHLWQADLKQPRTPPWNLHQTARLIAVVRAHPREADTVIWAEGNQVLRVSGAFAGAGDLIQQPLNLNAFQAVPLKPVRFGGAAGKTSGQPTMAQVLDQVLAEQPPLSLITQAALDRAHFEPERVLAWQRDARKRNWLPQLRVGGGFREYSLDQNFVIDGVDRFGVPTHNDLRQDDATRPFGYFGVTLVWDLEKLRYDPEQVDISKEGRYQAKYRTDLLTTVSQLYYARIDTLVKLRHYAKTLSDADAVSLRLKLREATDLLNALCDRPLLTTDITPPTADDGGSPR